MKTIAEGVYLFERLRGCNTYLLASESGLTLVDAATAGDVCRIVSQMETAGYDPTTLRSIVITHAHPDHLGGLAELVRRFNPEVAAHRLDAPAIEGTAQLPARTRLQRALAWLGERFPGTHNGTQVTRRLEDGDALDALGGLRVIHTPGHTPGSLCLLQEERGVLFCGDLLFHGNPLTGCGGLRYAPRAFSVDPYEIPVSAQKLSSLSVKALCMGHGEPILEPGGVQMFELLMPLSG